MIDSQSVKSAEKGGVASIRTATTREKDQGRLALTVVFLLGLGVFVAALWVFGSTISAQLNDVIKAAPAGFKLFMAWMAQFPYAQRLLD